MIDPTIPPENLTPEQAAERVRIMDEFLSHPGWKIVEAHYQRAEEFAHKQAIDGKGQDERNEAVSYVRVSRILRSWPKAHAVALKSALEDPESHEWMVTEPASR